jgi:hypothetical protein
MKKAFLLLQMAWCCYAFAQSPFQSLNFDQACAKAAKEKKVVLTVVESADCNQCNTVAEKGIGARELKRTLTDKCVVIKSSTIPESIQQRALYVFPDKFFGIIITDAEKQILQVYSGSSSYFMSYMDVIDKALEEEENPKEKISSIKAAYYEQSDWKYLQKLIKKIQSLNLEPAVQLTDELILKVPEDSAKSISFIQYLMRTAPVVSSETEKYINKDRDIYNMAWYRMDLPERIRINNRIIGKSIDKAIREKDQQLAYRTASYAQTTHQPNFEEGQKAYYRNLLRYFKEVKDTANYLRNASNYYDRIYQTVQVSAIKAKDSMNTEQQLSEMRKRFNLNQPPTDGTTVKQVVSVRPGIQSQLYANTLNEGAWNLYQLSKEERYLNKALSWAKRSVEFYELPENMDTYARLLYITGNKNEAIFWMEKAIQKQELLQLNSNEQKKILENMRAGYARPEGQTM